MTQNQIQLLKDLNSIFAEKCNHPYKPNEFQTASIGDIHDGVIIDKHLHYSVLISHDTTQTNRHSYWEYLYKVHDRCVEELAKPLAAIANDAKVETFYAFPPKPDGSTIYVQWGLFVIRATVCYDRQHTLDKISFDVLYGIGTNQPDFILLH